MKVKNKTTPLIQPGMLNKILFSFSSGKGTYSAVSLADNSGKTHKKEFIYFISGILFEIFHLRLAIIVTVII